MTGPEFGDVMLLVKYIILPIRPPSAWCLCRDGFFFSVNGLYWVVVPGRDTAPTISSHPILSYRFTGGALTLLESHVDGVNGDFVKHSQRPINWIEGHLVRPEACTSIFLHSHQVASVSYDEFVVLFDDIPFHEFFRVIQWHDSTWCILLYHWRVFGLLY
jgi:hypothetical protein